MPLLIDAEQPQPSRRERVEDLAAAVAQPPSVSRKAAPEFA